MGQKKDDISGQVTEGVVNAVWYLLAIVAVCAVVVVGMLIYIRGIAP